MKVPAWVWAQLVTIVIVALGAMYVTGTFTGKFDEFRASVLERLSRLERQMDEQNYRRP